MRERLRVSICETIESRLRRLELQTACDRFRDDVAAGRRFASDLVLADCALIYFDLRELGLWEDRPDLRKTWIEALSGALQTTTEGVVA